MSSCLSLWVVVLSGFVVSSAVAVDDTFRIAECRAQCLDKFLKPGDSGSDLRCRNEDGCLMCWEICEFLQDDFNVWKHLCDNTDSCFPGCQQACKFHVETNRRTERAVPSESVGRFPEPLTATAVEDSGVELCWSRPRGLSSSPESAQFVYVVFQRIHSDNNVKPWQEVTQTSEMMTTVDELVPGEKIDFRVVAVSGAGVFAITDVTYASNMVMTQSDSKMKTSVSRQTFVKSWDVVIDTQTSASSDSVDVVVSWTPPRLGEYVVVWEMVQGPLEVKGHLFTVETCVTITLERESVYRVFIELKSTELQSEYVTINTRNIYGANKINTDCMEAIVAGVAAAIGIFSILVIIFLLRRRLGGSKGQSGEIPIDSVKRKTVPPIEICEFDGHCQRCHSTPKLEDKLNSVRIFMENVEKLNQTLSPAFNSGGFVTEGLQRVSPPPYELQDSTPSTPQRGNAKLCGCVPGTSNKRSEPIFNFDDKREPK